MPLGNSVAIFQESRNICFFVLLFFLVLFFFGFEFFVFFGCVFFFFFGFFLFSGLASEDFEMDFPWAVLDSFH